jgi:hypothetical protein
MKAFRTRLSGIVDKEQFRLILKMFHVKHFCKIFQKNPYKSETNFPRAGVRWREKMAAEAKTALFL